MKKSNKSAEKLKKLYNVKIYSSMPDKVIEEYFINEYSQLSAIDKARELTKKENIILITAQKTEI